MHQVLGAAILATLRCLRSMTTGTKSYGSVSGPYFYYKTWNGTNGAYHPDGSTKWNTYTMNAVTVKNRVGAGIPLVGTQYPGVTGFTSNDLLQLQHDLVQQVRVHDFNAGICIAESRQTASLVTSTLSKIVGCAIDLKHGRVSSALRRIGVSPRAKSVVHVERTLLRHAELGRHSDWLIMMKARARNRKVSNKVFMTPAERRRMISELRERPLNTKDISGTWLELQYGWKPLLNDVYEATKATSVLMNPPAKATFKVKRSVVKQRSARFLTLGAAGTCWSDETVITTVTLTCHVTETVGLARSLGLVDPLQVAWEIVPFSFVVDWFVPIGTYLDTRAFMGKLSLQYGQSTMIRTKRVTYWRPPADSLYKKTYCEYSAVSFVRDPYGSTLNPPWPGFRGLDVAASSSHIKNAIALAHQLLS